MYRLSCRLQLRLYRMSRLCCRLPLRLYRMYRLSCRLSLRLYRRSRLCCRLPLRPYRMSRLCCRLLLELQLHPIRPHPTLISNAPFSSLRLAVRSAPHIYVFFFVPRLPVPYCGSHRGVFRLPSRLFTMELKDLLSDDNMPRPTSFCSCETLFLSQFKQPEISHNVCAD
jgi:hypothetical protein